MVFKKKYIALLFLLFSEITVYAQTDLEEYFNLCMEFGAPMDVVQLYQPFRTYKAEINGTISYVIKEDESLLLDSPYTEYQIWYTIDKDLGLYQTSLIVRGERTVLQHILTAYLKKFNETYGEPVYTHLNNGSLLIFWYSEDTFIVRARLILDIDNPYKFVSITYCSPLARHARLLRSLYNGADDDENMPAPVTKQEATPITVPGNNAEDFPESIEETSSESSEESASEQDEEAEEISSEELSN